MDEEGSKYSYKNTLSLYITDGIRWKWNVSYLIFANSKWMAEVMLGDCNIYFVQRPILNSPPKWSRLVFSFSLVSQVCQKLNSLKIGLNKIRKWQTKRASLYSESHPLHITLRIRNENNIQCRSLQLHCCCTQTRSFYYSANSRIDIYFHLGWKRQVIEVEFNKLTQHGMYVVYIWHTRNHCVPPEIVKYPHNVECCALCMRSTHVLWPRAMCTSIYSIK